MLKGITQIQINSQVGLTFAAGLRSMLRHNPDIMMVGEVRDMETAEICIRSSLTGHLVMSTLHTNDAPSAVTRLIDIGVEPYLVASGLLLLMAQRLVRRLCPKCKEETTIPEDIVKRYELKKNKAFKAKGCESCKQTGYSGRASIHELLMINQEIRALIANKANTSEIRDAAKKNGMKTLVEDGLEKVVEGVTSVEEVMSSVFE